jgi:ubiquinone/menaquinone biosynthesis C-methylase UbiE
MEEEKLKEFARQLRKPEGAFGLEVGERMNKGNVYINQAAIDTLSVTAGDTILELGMGNGFFVKDILTKESSVVYTGYDFSADMVEESIKRNKNFIEQNRARFILGEAQRMPFEDRTFTKAFTVNTLYFWDDHGKVLAEFHRVLKDGGKLLIAIRPKRNMEQMAFTQYGFARFSKEDLVSLLNNHHFEVQEVIEKTEPEQEINGKKLMTETLIVCAVKK